MSGKLLVGSLFLHPVLGGRRKRERLARVPVILPLVFTLVAFSHAASIGALQEAAVETQLNLGSDKVMAGGSAFVPLVFSPAPGAEIGGVLAEITFPNRLLSFEEVKNDVLLDTADAEVDAAVKADEKNADYSILELRVRSRTRRAIPAGVVVTVILKVSENAGVGEKIDLESRASAETTDDPPKSVDVPGSNGSIEVIEMPLLFACFFYMH